MGIISRTESPTDQTKECKIIAKKCSNIKSFLQLIKTPQVVLFCQYVACVVPMGNWTWWVTLTSYILMIFNININITIRQTLAFHHIGENAIFYLFFEGGVHFICLSYQIF